MPRLEKILVPVDYSDGSRVAMEYALFLAERFDAEIKVLHVAEIPMGEEHTVVRPDTGEQQLLSELIMQQAREGRDRVPRSLRLRRDDPDQREA